MQKTLSAVTNKGFIKCFPIKQARHCKVTSCGKSPFSIWELINNFAARCSGVGSLSVCTKIKRNISNLKIGKAIKCTRPIYSPKKELITKTIWLNLSHKHVQQQNKRWRNRIVWHGSCMFLMFLSLQFSLVGIGYIYSHPGISPQTRKRNWILLKVLKLCGHVYI